MNNYIAKPGPSSDVKAYSQSFKGLDKERGYYHGIDNGRQQDRPVPVPDDIKPAPHSFNEQAEYINRVGYSNLFTDKNISEEQVSSCMMFKDSMIRYSPELARSHNRQLAIVLFRCAQFVFKGRLGELPNTVVFDRNIVIHGSTIQESLADFDYDMVFSVLQELSEIGVLTRYCAFRSGETIFTDWFTFADEDVYFPPHGQLKFS